MDPKMIEMNNLRVLNDYLNQTIDVLSRQPRTPQQGFGFSPFAPIPTPTDTVYGPWYAQQMQHAYSPFGVSPFPGYTPGFGGMDPFTAQRSFSPQSFGPQGFGPTFGPQSFGPQGFGPTTLGPQSFGPTTFGPQSFGPQGYGWQQPWSPMIEVQRQAQISQALAAKQQVLEAMCRACGIPV